MKDILAELAVLITADTSKLEKGFADAEKQTKSLGQQLNQVGKYAGIASAAIVTGFAAATMKFADTADKLEEMSQRTGVSTKFIQQLGYAAKLTGSDTSGLEVAIKKMQVSITGANEKTGKYGKLLKSLQGLGVEDQFEMLADLISEIEDPTERAAAAVEIFGRSGTDLLPILMEGSAGIQQFKDEANKLGIVMGEDTVKKGAALQDSLDRLKMSFEGLIVKIGSSTEFQKFIDQLTMITGKVIEWIDKNPELIRTIFQIAAAVMVLVGVMKLFAIAQAIATSMSGWIGIAALAVGAIASIAAVASIEDMFKNMSVPGLASGGIVNSPTLAMIGENGPEAVTPLNQMGQNIALYIDGEQITNVIEKRLYEQVNTGSGKYYG